MNDEHAQYLFEKYPDLYRGRYLPITQNLMPFGFETGDGWFDIIDKLSAEITLLDEKDGSQTIAVQVKEKFGGLRYYVESGSDAVLDAIDRAEDECEKTCELCGEPGSLKGVGWLSTMCDACWARTRDKEKA
jgi:hypothetical protein